MRTPLAAFAAIAVSCGGRSSGTQTSTETTTTETTITTTAAPAPLEAEVEAERQPDLVEFHEWGLVDVDLAAGIAELSAGPGAPARPVVARKPVIYAHLAPGTDRVSGEVHVRLEGGTFLEHWPAGTIEESTLRWPFAITRGACAARGPARDLSRACDSPDGTCEVLELPRYVTDDHDCIDVAGTQASLLFYRAQIPIASLPITVVRGPDLVLRAGALDLALGPRTMLRISTGLGGPWPPGRVVCARAERAQGEVVIPVGTEALDPAAERAAMERVLVTELGLTASEARVFLDAWAAELFGAQVPSAGREPAERETTRRSPTARPPEDVLLYWLSRQEIERIAPVLVTVPSGERRAWLVRVSLGAVATAGPAAP